MRLSYSRIIHYGTIAAVCAIVPPTVAAHASLPLAHQRLAGDSTAGKSTAGDSAAVVVVDLKPADGKLSDLLPKEIAKASAAGRTPFVELGATWCGPCKALAASLGDARMIDAFAKTYIIRLDQDAWQEQLTPMGLTAPSIPMFFAVDSTGHGKGPTIDGGAWQDDIPENMAPPLKTFFQANMKK